MECIKDKHLFKSSTVPPSQGERHSLLPLRQRGQGCGNKIYDAADGSLSICCRKALWYHKEQDDCHELRGPKSQEGPLPERIELIRVYSIGEIFQFVCMYADFFLFPIPLLVVSGCPFCHPVHSKLIKSVLFKSRAGMVAGRYFVIKPLNRKPSYLQVCRSVGL
jgi:hypothetical protein